MGAEVIPSVAGGDGAVVGADEQAAKVTAARSATARGRTVRDSIEAPLATITREQKIRVAA